MIVRAAPSPHARRRIARGFTLIELVVGGVVVAIIGAGIVTAVSNMVKAKNKSVARQQAYARADAAGARVAADLIATVRSADLQECRLQVMDGGTGPVQRDSLLVLTRSIKPVRGRDDIAEGGEYESQFRVDGFGTTAGLWRRADPAFDRAQDGGGVASLLSPGVFSFSVEASDGTAWFTTWDSDSDGLPHAVRVVVGAQSDDGTADATVRRVIAIDRPPLPPDTTDTSTTSGDTPAGTSGTSSTGGGS